MQIGFEHGEDDQISYAHPYAYDAVEALLLANRTNCELDGWWIYNILENEIETSRCSRSNLKISMK